MQSVKCLPTAQFYTFRNLPVKRINRDIFGKQYRVEVVSLSYFEQIISFCAIIDYSNTQKESFVCANFLKIYTKIFYVREEVN